MSPTAFNQWDSTRNTANRSDYHSHRRIQTKLMIARDKYCTSGYKEPLIISDMDQKNTEQWPTFGFVNSPPK